MIMRDVRGVTGLWDFSTAGNIWRILPAGERLIVGEERDIREKSVSYFCVALEDGRPLWKGIRPAEHWWTGIEAVHRGMVFIHEYPVPSMPGHGKILALDLLTGSTVWENGDLAFGFIRGGSLYASREMFERRQYYELDMMTGEVVREIPDEAPGPLRPRGEEKWEMDVGLPLPADAPPAGARHAFPPEAVLRPGETLSHAGMEISNFYEELPGAGGSRTLREHLFALDGSTGEVLFRDVVCEGLSFPAGTTFIRAGERILYVRERTTLRSFSLSAGASA